MTSFAQMGFLNTKAFFYTDIVLIYMCLFPFLLLFSVWLAIKERYLFHRLFQNLLFLVTLIMLLLFYYELFLSHTFDEFVVLGEDVSHNVYYLFIFHLLVSMTTLILWISTMMFASADKKRRALPGLYSTTHKRAGGRVSIGVVLTSLTFIGLYWMLYVV